MRKAVRKGMKTARRGSATPETRGPRLEDRALPSDGPSRAASPLRCATIWGSQSISAVQRLQLMHDFQVFFFFSGIKRLRRVGWDSGPGKMPG